MAIRIRTIQGIRVALCAAETDEMPGDLYLSDGDHYALAAKFCRDWQGSTIDWSYPEEWAAMDTQKMRDAEEELRAWLATESPPTAPAPAPPAEGMRAEVERLRGALIEARAFVERERDGMLECVCKLDRDTLKPIRETMDPDEAPFVEEIESVLSEIDAALAAGESDGR